MKNNKYFILTINWILLLLIPIWGIPFVIYVIFEDSYNGRKRSATYRMFVKGDEYWWTK